MNKMRVFLLFAVLVGVISACQSKSEQTAGQEQDTMDYSLAVAPTEDEKTIFGVVEDASMPASYCNRWRKRGSIATLSPSTTASLPVSR